jgi:rhodanese-related sulfurtransferase
VSATEAYALVERGEAVLLDVREDHEWVEAHAPMAVSAPMSRLRADLAGIPADRRIVCVCAVGGRSAAVTEALRRAGRDAVNLAGGMHAWLAAGLPVVTGG